ncbi:MAG TPA: hypothetical protein VFG66_16240 [Gemmatimonadales bacterium]|nr:hypothetical protein [Gemmatimonadales bacterium]
MRARARWAAAAGAAAAFLLAGYTAVTESMPVLHIYDGYWMLFGAAMGVVLAAPFVWSWARDKSLPAVVIVAVLGCWLPIVWLALRRHTPVMQRMKGAWYLMGGDVVAAAIPVGVAFLWMALRPPGPGKQLKL